MKNDSDFLLNECLKIAEEANKKLDKGSERVNDNINSLQGNEHTKDELNIIQSVGALSFHFRKFRNECQILIDNNVILITDKGLFWNYSKVSLCDYFKERNHYGKGKLSNKDLAILIDIFNLNTNTCILSKTNERAHGESKDYKKIKEMLKI